MFFTYREFLPIFEENCIKICNLNLVQSFLITRTAFNNALNENIGNRFKRCCVPFGFHPYFRKGSNHDAARFEAAGLSPTSLFSSSSFPSATTSPLNSWHSQDAIDNPWYFIRKHFNFCLKSDIFLTRICRNCRRIRRLLPRLLSKIYLHTFTKLRYY